jgi:hypothetical protein
MSRHQKAGQNHNIKIDNESFENVTKFKYLGTTVTDQNSIYQEIKGRFSSGNACYHLAQNIFSYRLLSKNIKIKIYKIIILPLVLYVCET